MDRRSLVTGAVLVALLVCGVTAAEPLKGQEHESRVLSDRFYMTAGWFGADLSTDAAIGFGSLVGTFIRFEDTLGLDDTNDTLRVTGFWRFSRRSRITWDYTSLDRNGNAGIIEDIEFEDKIYQAGALVTTKFDQKLYGLSYAFSFFNNGKIEAGINAGLTSFDFDLSLSGIAAVVDENGMVIESAQFRTESEHFLAPVPTVGINLHYAITPKVIFSYRTSGLDLDIGDYEGRVLDNRGTVEWFPVRNFGIGVGLTTTSVELKNFDTNRPYNVDYRYGGFTFYFSGVF